MKSLLLKELEQVIDYIKQLIQEERNNKQEKNEV